MGHRLCAERRSGRSRGPGAADRAPPQASERSAPVQDLRGCIRISAQRHGRGLARPFPRRPRGGGPARRGAALSPDRRFTRRDSLRVPVSSRCVLERRPTPLRCARAVSRLCGRCHRLRDSCDGPPSQARGGIQHPEPGRPGHRAVDGSGDGAVGRRHRHHEAARRAPGFPEAAVPRRDGDEGQPARTPSRPGTRRVAGVALHRFARRELRTHRPRPARETGGDPL